MNLRKLCVVFSLGLGVAMADGVERTEPQLPTTDNRQLVEMPDEVQQLMREHMRDHLLALSEILGYLADSDFSSAADVAEQRLGESSIGRHRAAGMGPGRYMPLPMRQIGRGMHEAATKFAGIANTGNREESYAALQEVVALCAACHTSYRIR